jgi:hypothetical protein
MGDPMSTPSTSHPNIDDFFYEGETAEDLALYSAVGRAVILWGQLEYNLSVKRNLKRDE